VLAAHCADAGCTVDRRGRRACLLKGLPHEEIAPRCVRWRPARRRSGRDDARARRRPPGWCGAAARWVDWAAARSRMNCSPARSPRRCIICRFIQSLAWMTAPRQSLRRSGQLVIVGQFEIAARRSDLRASVRGRGHDDLAWPWTMPDESRRGTGAYFGVAELVFGIA